MNKYRKEEYITQRMNKSGKYSFIVRVRTDETDVTKTFNERNYPSCKLAFESAIQFRDKTLYEFRQGIALKRTNATVQDMFDSFIDTTPLSYETKRKYTLLYNKYIKHRETRMQDLTRADIAEDLNKMVDVATDCTITKVFTIWKNAIIQTALAKDIIYRDLTLGIRKPQSHLIVSKRDHYVDREILDKVEQLIRSSIQSNYNARIAVFLLEVLYYTGMRPAEAIALTRDDIRDGYIFVTKELGSSSDDTNVVRRCKTPDSIRSIPINANLQPILDELMDYARYDTLFFKDDGHYMDSNWLGNVITRVCKKAGVKFNMYRLRHNLATSLVTNNVDQKTTIELLGHSNYDMSLYYASSNNELKEDAIALIH